MPRLVLIITFCSITLNAQLNPSEVNYLDFSTDSIDSLSEQKVGIKFIFSRNKTNYDFKNDQGLSESGIFSDHGASFGVEKSLFNLFNKKLELSINVFIDEFNQIGSIPENTFSWNSFFLTTGGSTSIPLIALRDSKFIRLSAGVGVSKCVFAKQTINDIEYDIKDHEEFDGVFSKASFGLCMDSFKIENIIFSIALRQEFFTSLDDNSVQELNINNTKISLQVRL